MRSVLLVAALAALLSLPAARAEAASSNPCDLEIDDLGSVQWNGGRGAGYDVYDATLHRQAVEFEVRGARGCPFLVGFDSASSDNDRRLTKGAGHLRYQLYADYSLGAILRDVPGAAASELLSGVVGQGGRTRMRFYVVIPPLQVAAPDTYKDRVEANLYDFRDGKARRVDDRDFDIEARVPTAVNLSFSADFDSSPGAASINFPAVQRNDVRDLYFRARSNAGYELRLLSLNGGIMRYIGFGDSSTIPYTLSIDGAVVPLSFGRVTELSGAPTGTPAIGNTHRLTVRIDDVGDATAGTYADVLLLTVQALN
jgi:spore coat protein U-like protein